MKNRIKLAVLLSGALMLPAAARAEMLTGTVETVSVDSGSLRILRNDTNQIVTVAVNQQDGLAEVRKGDTIALDAQKTPLGTWTVDTVKKFS